MLGTVISARDIRINRQIGKDLSGYAEQFMMGEEYLYSHFQMCEIMGIFIHGNVDDQDA